MAARSVQADGTTERFTVTIDIAESIGSDTYVYGAVVGQPDGDQIVARINKDLTLVVGDQSSLVADPPAGTLL